MMPLHQSLAKDYGKQQQYMVYDVYGDRAVRTRLTDLLDTPVQLVGQICPIDWTYVSNTMSL